MTIVFVLIGLAVGFACVVYMDRRLNTIENLARVRALSDAALKLRDLSLLEKDPDRRAAIWDAGCGIDPWDGNVMEVEVPTS